MFKKFCNYLMLLLGTLICSSAYSQQSISGTVLDGKSEPLIGVNILVKNTGRGTVTDLDGKYALQANQGETLVFSFTGFTSKEVVVGSNPVMNITLDEGAALDEVVVVAYGSQKKVTVTGAVTALQGDKLVKSPAVWWSSNKVVSLDMMVPLSPSGVPIPLVTAAH